MKIAQFVVLAMLGLIVLLPLFGLLIMISYELEVAPLEMVFITAPVTMILIPISLIIINLILLITNHKGTYIIQRQMTKTCLIYIYAIMLYFIMSLAEPEMQSYTPNVPALLHDKKLLIIWLITLTLILQAVLILNMDKLFKPIVSILLVSIVYIGMTFSLIGMSYLLTNNFDFSSLPLIFCGVNYLLCSIRLIRKTIVQYCNSNNSKKPSTIAYTPPKFIRQLGKAPALIALPIIFTIPMLCTVAFICIV